MRLRLLVDAPADGAVNMAVDETLLESASSPDAPATLRLYRFRSPTVTFGYGQALSDAVDPLACERLGVGYARRITGGRALLHQDELTYSFAAPSLARSVKSVYRTVTGAIRTALERLHIPIDPPPPDRRLPRPERSRGAAHLPCLAVATGHEITAGGGSKLVASAMRFRRRAFLQHGSILWSVDAAVWKELTPLGRDDALHAVGLRNLGGTELSEGTLVDALSSAFSELVGVAAIESKLSPREADQARRLEEKYRSREWTEERRWSDSRLVDNSEAVW